MRNKEMQDYVETIWKRSSIQNLIKENKNITPGKFKKFKWRTKAPKVKIIHQGTWASAWYRNHTHTIAIEPWFATGGSEVKSTLRHEVTHALLDGCLIYLNEKKYYTGTDPHRKEYKNMLKIVAPRTWQVDMYWQETPQNKKERLKWVKRAS